MKGLEEGVCPYRVGHEFTKRHGSVTARQGGQREKKTYSLGVEKQMPGNEKRGEPGVGSTHPKVEYTT